MIRLLSLLAWVGWILIYWQGGLRVLHGIRTAADMRDKALLTVIAFATTLLIPLQVLLTLTENSALPTGIDLIGFAMILIGIAGTFFARHILGALWTAPNAVQPDHQIIDRGPYAVVRHPIYTFAMLLYAGTMLVFPTPLIVGAAMIALAAYVLKTQHEDSFLKANLSGYDAYARRVRFRLIPYIY